MMFLFAGRTTNAYGRTFHRGKSIEKDMRSLIIDDISSGGGNVSTEYYPGCFRAIGSKYKVSGVTCFKHMEDLLSNGRKSPSPCFGQGSTEKADGTRTSFGAAAVKMQTFENLTYQGRKENIEMMRPAGEIFTPDNQVGQLDRV